MKTIGIAAVTAEGASSCYKSIVTLAGQRLGFNQHPEITLDNPPFANILAAQKREDWTEVARILTDSVNKLASIGAEVAIIPANSVHYAFDNIESNARIPLLSIVEITADECVKQGYKKVAVLGVGQTMTGGLYDEPLKSRGVESLQLPKDQQEALNTIIYNELVQGEIVPQSVTKIINICSGLKGEGCEAVLLACTELPMVINRENAPLSYIDTTFLLAQKAVDYSLV
jgi:aspartate racemase